MRHWRGQRLFGIEQLDPRLKVGQVGHWAIGQISGALHGLHDYGGYGNDGFLSGGWSAADLSLNQHRSAFRLDGSAFTYAQFGSTLPFGIAADSPVTVAMWARLNQTPALVNLFTLATGVSNILIAYWWNSGNGMIVGSGDTTNVGAGSAAALSSLTIDLDITRWHHWAFTWTGGGATRPLIYCDGHDISQNDAIGLSGYYINGFRAGIGVGNGFTSAMSASDVRIYNRVVSQPEIALLANPAFSINIQPRRRSYASAVTRRFILTHPIP